MSNKASNSSENVTIFFIIFSALFLAYLPAIQGYYVHHDDFQIWASPNMQYNHPYSKFLFYTVGRPLAGVYLEIVGYWVDNFNDARWVRAFSLLLLSINSFLYFNWLKSFEINKLSSIALSIFTFSIKIQLQMA